MEKAPMDFPMKTEHSPLMSFPNSFTISRASYPLRSSRLSYLSSCRGLNCKTRAELFDVVNWVSVREIKYGDRILTLLSHGSD